MGRGAWTFAADWLARVRRTDPRKLAFFTGRDQSQSMTGWWAQAYGTPNTPPMAASARSTWRLPASTRWAARSGSSGRAGLGQDRAVHDLGVAEDHDSNPIKMGLGKLKERGVKVIGVNPVRTGYNAIADEWLGITPGTDGLLILALAHELLRTGKIDVDYLIRYTNAPWLGDRQSGRQ